MRFKIGQSVRVASMARIAVGRVTGFDWTRVLVRLPNWQADGVHLDVACAPEELETGHERAAVCRCVYCPGYGRR